MAIPKKAFGRTGHMSTRTIFGAAAFSGVTQAEADRTMELLLERGINHIDTAASYGDAEIRIGPWMEAHREDFFLATKTGERSYDGAKREFERSLERLRVSAVDLIQMHYLVGEEEWAVAMGAGGALEYLLEARDQGLVKYIGVTGHDVAIAGMHRKSLDTLRLRLGAAALQLSNDAECALSRRLRGSAADLQGAELRRADH